MTILDDVNAMKRALHESTSYGPYMLWVFNDDGAWSAYGPSNQLYIAIYLVACEVRNS